jgi:hypothetical protein
MAKADAAYQRFQQERDAAAQAAKERAQRAEEDRKRREAADQEFKRQLKLAAAAAPRSTSVSSTKLAGKSPVRKTGLSLLPQMSAAGDFSGYLDQVERRSYLKEKLCASAINRSDEPSGSQGCSPWVVAPRLVIERMHLGTPICVVMGVGVR